MSKAESSKQSRKLTLKHFVESIKPICLSAFQGDTAFGFKNAEVIDARYTKISGRVRKPRFR